MIGNKQFSFIFIGLALFAMFFGSGNLIFPLYVGHLAKDQCLLASLGFLLTAVAVPFLGVIAMVVYKGDYTAFFRCLGNRFGSILIAILLTIWIPLGSAPRCITLAYSSLSSYVNVGPLWVFSALYCVLIFFVVGKKGRMLDILGYVLTPLLLACLSMIIFKGVSIQDAFAMPSGEGMEYFYQGLLEGYNTMDLIAAFFFSASVIDILQKTSHEKMRPLWITFKACVVGISLLGVVYVSLIALAGAHADMLQTVPKDQMLAYIAKDVLGPQMGMIAVVAIFLACLTTSVALVVVYAEFLSKTLFKKYESETGAKISSLLITFIMSLAGLKGITMVTAPVLEIFYPFLIGMIIVNLSIYGYKRVVFKRSEGISDRSV